jgi:hypothetical protein
MAAEPEEPGRRSVELVIAVAVVVISLASLFTALYQSIVMRRTLDGAVLTPGQKRILFQFERPAEDGPAPVWYRLNRIRDELDLTVCYCSVFDDCWTARARAYRQGSQKIDKCTVVSEPGFIG